MNAYERLEQIEVPTDDNGTEVLWAVAAGVAYRIISVPVFAYGLSLGTEVAARPSPRSGRLALDHPTRVSLGATVRCYAAPPSAVRELYAPLLLKDLERLGINAGPATLFEPTIVAINLVKRSQITGAARYFDALVGDGILESWETGDPATPPNMETGTEASDPWELVHPLPNDRGPTYITMHH